MTRYIYFIKPLRSLGPIKIGVSTRPRLRLSQLLEWSPISLEIVLTIPGDHALERNIHECFADCHSHKEWFHPEPRLLTAIERMQAGVDVAEAIDLNARLGSLQSLRLRQFREAIGTSQEMEAQ